MMSNPMQRLADLEARVKALTAERDALQQELLQRNPSQPDINELTDLINNGLERVERNIREDFIGKFAGNFLLATETITNRVVAVEARESQIEKQQKGLEVRLQNHQITISRTLDEATANQRQLLLSFLEANKNYNAKNEATLKAQQAAVAGCNAAAAATAKASDLCATFARDYEVISCKATNSLDMLMVEMRDTATRHLAEHFNAVNDIWMSVYHKAKQLTSSQYKKRILGACLGVFAGLIFSSGFAWLSQPQRYVEQNAQRWRSLTTGLTPDQYDKVMKAIAAVEAKNKADAEQHPH